MLLVLTGFSLSTLPVFPAITRGSEAVGLAPAAPSPAAWLRPGLAQRSCLLLLTGSSAGFMPDLDGLRAAAKPLCKVSLLTLMWNHVVSSALKLRGLILCFASASRDYI